MTMSYTAVSVISEMETHIQRYGRPNSAWYCGIATDPQDRLQNGHNATPRENAARWWDAGSEVAARSIEQYFHARSCKGGPGGGDGNTRYVYLYIITASTRE